SGGTGVISRYSQVKTFVIVVGGTADVNRANWIAWGGSGMVPAANWASAPTATDRANCTTCVDAFLASNAADLAAALQSAIDQGQTAGVVADQQSIPESGYELPARWSRPST